MEYHLRGTYHWHFGGHSKITNLDPPFLVNKYVPWLEIQVSNMNTMNRLNPASKADKDAP